MRLNSCKLKTGSRQDKTVLSCLQLCSHRRHGQDKTRQDSFVLSVSAVRNRHHGCAVVLIITFICLSAHYNFTYDMTCYMTFSRRETATSSQTVLSLYGARFLVVLSHRQLSCVSNTDLNRSVSAYTVLCFHILYLFVRIWLVFVRIYLCVDPVDTLLLRLSCLLCVTADLI